MPLYVGSRAAADFGNPAFRAWWIAKAQAALAAGYRGLFIDDVFMERRTYLSGGATCATPKDPRTGTTMTEANWQKYMADFMVAVRAALPSAEIAHDVLWQKGDSGDVLRGLQAANVVSVDGGFTTNVGHLRLRRRSRAGPSASRRAAAAWSSTIRRRRRRARLYNFAAYTLVDNGASALANDASTAPGAFWSGYDVDLGSPNTARYQVSTGVWRRDFTRGIVLVNEPYRSARTVSNVPAGYQDLDGVPRSSVTLAGGQGVVLVPIPTPVPTPTPVPPVADARPGRGRPGLDVHPGAGHARAPDEDHHRLHRRQRRRQGPRERHRRCAPIRARRRSPCRAPPAGSAGASAAPSPATSASRWSASAAASGSSCCARRARSRRAAASRGTSRA